PLTRAPPGAARRAAGAQARRQLPAQRPAALHIDRLVDRLVAHPHLRLIRELPGQHRRDLPRRPPFHQPGLHILPQPPVPREPRPPRRGPSCGAGRRGGPAPPPPAPGTPPAPGSGFPPPPRGAGGRPGPPPTPRRDPPAARPPAIPPRSANDRNRPEPATGP